MPIFFVKKQEGAKTGPSFWEFWFSCKFTCVELSHGQSGWYDVCCEIWRRMRWSKCEDEPSTGSRGEYDSFDCFGSPIRHPVPMQFPVQERLPRGTCSYFSALQLASPSFRLLTAPPTNSGGSISINTDDNSDSINTLTTTTTRDSLHCFLSPNVLKLISPYPFASIHFIYIRHVSRHRLTESRPNSTPFLL